MKYLTPIADSIDARLQGIEDDLWQYTRKTSIEDQSNFAVPKVMGSIAVGMTVKGMRFVADAFAIDLLRIGDGIEKGKAGNNWGYVEDAARMLVIGGALLKLAGRLAGGARALQGVAISADVATGLPQCAWVAAARGARFQGVYVTAEDLAAELGVSLKSLKGVANVTEVVPTLRQIGVTVNEVRLPVTGAWDVHQFTSWADTERVLGSTLGSLGANGDVCMIGIAGPGFGGHALLVRKVANGMQFIDRTGTTVTKLAELERLYPGISQTRPTATLLHFPDTRIAEAARIAASPEVLYAMIAVRVFPALVESGVLLTTPPKRAAPPQLQKAKDQGSLPQGRTCVAPKANSPLPVLSFFRYIVQVGDSLANLARRIYHDESQWKLILDINRAVFGGNVKPNDSLDILAVGRVELFMPSMI